MLKQGKIRQRVEAKRQRQGQGASVTAQAAVTHAEAMKLLFFLRCTYMQRFLYDILHIVFDRSSVTALAALTHA